MSYNGTVRCGHCYKQGHNRLGCPERRKQAKENPESYEGRRWLKEQDARRKSIANRVCSYCKLPNHNRRGCSLLEEDRKLVISRQIEYRNTFHEVTSSVGFAPGSLVKVPTGQQADPLGVWSRGFVGIVTDLKWCNIDFLLGDTVLNYGWRERDRKLASVRVVSVFGDHKEDYWNAPPTFNEVKHLSVLQLSKILKPAFAPDLDFGADQVLTAELVGPANAVTLPVFETQITPELNSRFHFDPGPRADEFDKARSCFTSEHWRNIRPDEFKERPPRGW